ncbi:MAG: Inorganic pyrophosphatase, partial [uncultured Pseudonocardia sp.]
GLRRHHRDPQGWSQQVRGGPQDRPHPPGPHPVHGHPVPRRLRVHREQPRRGRRPARRAGARPGADVPRLPHPVPGDRDVPDEGREGRRRQGPLRPVGRPAPGAPARHPPPRRVRPRRDPALLRDLQGAGARQERRGRHLGRPRRRGAGDQGQLPAGAGRGGRRGRGGRADAL